jgi:hypothetical protein
VSLVSREMEREEIDALKRGAAQFMTAEHAEAAAPSYAAFTATLDTATQR